MSFAVNNSASFPRQTQRYVSQCCCQFRLKDSNDVKRKKKKKGRTRDSINVQYRVQGWNIRRRNLETIECLNISISFRILFSLVVAPFLSNAMLHSNARVSIKAFIVISLIVIVDRSFRPIEKKKEKEKEKKEGRAARKEGNIVRFSNRWLDKVEGVQLVSQSYSPAVGISSEKYFACSDRFKNSVRQRENALYPTTIYFVSVIGFSASLAFFGNVIKCLTTSLCAAANRASSVSPLEISTDVVDFCPLCLFAFAGETKENSARRR